MSDFWKTKPGLTPIEDEPTNETETPEVEESEENKEVEEVKEEVNDETPKKEEGEEENKDEEGKEVKNTEEESKEEKSEDEEVNSEAQEEPAEERSLNKISELSEGQFESEEDLWDTYNSMQKISGENIIEQLNSQIEEVHGEGYTIGDIFAFKSKDFDSMSETDVITEHLYLKTPDITEIEIQAELEQYNILNKSQEELDVMIEDGEITQSKVNAIQASLIRKTREAREDLKDFQDSMDINDLELYSQPAPTEEKPQKSQEEIDAEVKHYDSRIDAFSDETIQVGSEKEPHELKLVVSDEDRNGIREFLSNEGDKSWTEKRWFKEDGTVNIDQLTADANKIINYERNLGIAFNQGKSAGVSKNAKEIDNVDFSKGQTREVQKEGKSAAANAVREANE